MSKNFISIDRVIEITSGETTRGQLAQLRFTGKGPRFYKPTPKTVLYDEAEVIAWVEGSARTSTNEAA